MSATEGPGESTVRRYLDRERNTVVARGDFSGRFAAYLDHAERWQSAPDGLSQVMMRQALGAAALQLSFRPNDELVARTPGDPLVHVAYARLLDGLTPPDKRGASIQFQRALQLGYPPSAAEFDRFLGN